MIYYNKNRYYPKQENVIVLPVEEGYLYVSKDVYDDALIMHAKYAPETRRSLTKTQEENIELINYAREVLPDELEALADMLAYAPEVEMDIEKIAGSLSVITSMVTPSNFITLPTEMRKTLRYNKNIMKEYQNSWKAFELSLVPEDIVAHAVPYVMGSAEVIPILTALLSGGALQMNNNSVQQSTTEEDDIEYSFENGALVFEDPDAGLTPEEVAAKYGIGISSEVKEDAGTKQEEKTTKEPEEEEPVDPTSVDAILASVKL